MKTKEFIEKLNSMTVKVQVQTPYKFGLFTFGNKPLCTVNAKSNRINPAENRTGLNADLLNVIMEYLNTPTDEREDETKYHVLAPKEWRTLVGMNDFFKKSSYRGIRVTSEIIKNVNDSEEAYQFTLEEIKKYKLEQFERVEVE